MLIWWAQGWTQVLIVYVLMTLFFYGAYAVMATFIAENFPAELRATAASFSGTLAINLGFGLGPLAITYAATIFGWNMGYTCLLYTSPSPRDGLLSRMPSSA